MNGRLATAVQPASARPAPLAPVRADGRLQHCRILIVDDEPANVKLLASFLRAAAFTDVVSTTDSRDVVALVADVEPDVLLLDLHMPHPDGFELMGMLTPWTTGSPSLPILVLTADATSETKRRALGAGATDFLTKPFDPAEVVLRIRNLLISRLLQVELREQNDELERRVLERTSALEEARLELFDRLALIAEFRSDATGQHAQRVGRTAALLARELGLPRPTVELIRRAAALHDIGKVGISDEILSKRGALDAEERDMIRFHVSIGADMLAGSRSELLQMSEEIALTHHERWDGHGYPQGLKGEEIPLSGRIVAVADVFDTMTSRRPYRDPSTPAAAAAEIVRLRGTQFDPHVVNAFAKLDHELLVRSTDEFDVAA